MTDLHNQKLLIGFAQDESVDQIDFEYTHPGSDFLRFAFESATLGWAVERSWFSWSGEAGRVLYEPTQDIGARAGWTMLTVRPVKGLKLVARAGRTQIIDDGNEKHTLSGSAGFDLLTGPRLTVAYTLPRTEACLGVR